jgi:hypothetical protein
VDNSDEVSVAGYVNPNSSETATVTVGKDLTIDCYTIDSDDAYDRLKRIAKYCSSIRYVINKPLSTLAIKPGSVLYLTDSRMASAAFLALPAHVRSITYDFIAKQITIEGEFSSTTGESIPDPFAADTILMVDDDTIDMLSDDEILMLGDIP